MELHRRYPFDPDSIMVKRETVFKNHGITPADVEQFLKERREDPKKWDPLLILLKERLGEGAKVQMKNFQKTTPESTKKPEQQ